MKKVSVLAIGNGVNSFAQRIREDVDQVIVLDPPTTTPVKKSEFNKSNLFEISNKIFSFNEVKISRREKKRRT